MDTPNPDPGEEYQHVNTQLFGLIDPPANRGKLAPDMVAPVNAPPLDPSAPAGQMGFTFDRFGVRLPAVAISAWSPPQNVVNDLHHHTSVIQTLRKRWNLGQPLTARDACAPDLAPVLTLDEPRPPGEWPDVRARPVPKFDISAAPRDVPLAPLPKSMFHACLAILDGMDEKVPEIAEDSSINGGEAIDLIRESAGKLFPALKQASRVPPSNR